MTIVYFTALLLGGWAFVSNKRNTIRDIVLVLFLVILGSAPRVGYDTKNFETMYITLQSSGLNEYSSSFFGSMQGYLRLMMLFQKLGVTSFYIFKFITLATLSIGVYKSFGKLCINNSVLIFMYLTSTFSIDAIQHRNTLALLILLIGIYFLLTNEKYGTFIFAIFVCIAASIHITFLVYFLFVIAKEIKVKERVLLKIILLITCIVLFVTFFNRTILDVLATAVNFVLSDKARAYLEVRTRFGVLYPLIVYTMQLVLLMYCHHQMKHSKKFYRSTHLEMSRIVLYGNILIYPTLFLTYYSLSTERMLRNLILINLVVFVNYFCDGTIPREKRLLGRGIVLGAGVFNMIYINFMTGPASDILLAIFHGKIFWAN